MTIPEFLRAGIRRLGLPVTRIVPTREAVSTGYSFDRKGLSPGVDVGKGDPLMIFGSTNGKVISDTSAMNSYYGWVYICVRALAREAASMEFQLFKVGKTEEQYEHEILDLLDGVNEFQTGPELKATIAMHLKLTGNAYLLMTDAKGTPVKNDTQKPDCLYTLNPGNVKVNLDKTSFPWRIAGYTYRIENARYEYEPYQIVHIKDPDPGNPYVGRGVVESVAAWIDLDRYLTESNRQFFLNGARLGGVLQSDTVAEAELNALRISWEAAHSGVENAHKIVVLPKGVKYVATQIGPKDMDFEVLSKDTADKILAAFNVSRTVIGTMESDTNRATAETADYVFAKRTIKPMMDLIVSYLNEFLVPRYGEGYYLSFLDPTPEDKAFRIQEMQAMVASKAIMSADEARARYAGLGPIENGDQVMTDSLAVPLGKVISQSVPPPGKGQKGVDAAPGAADKSLQPRRVPTTQAARNSKKRSAILKDISAQLAAAAASIMATKQPHAMSHDEYGEVWKKVDAAARESEVKMTKAFKELDEKQMKIVLAKLPALVGGGKSVRKKDTVDSGDLFDEDSWVNATIDLNSPILYDLYRAESLRASGQYGTPVDATTIQRVQDSLNRAIALMARNYQQSTLDMLLEKINAGMADGSGLDAITEQVRGVYEFSEQYRAERVARTETWRTANDATKEGWKQSGTVVTIKWFTADDGSVCPFCKEFDGKTVGIDENFADKGDSLDAGGETLDLNYDNIGNPPLHVNCRCYIQPDELAGLE